MNRMRIAFISAGNLYLCPYIRKYLDVMAGAVSYDILYWDRHGVKEDGYGAANIYRYSAAGDELVSRWKKLSGYLGFRSFCKKLLIKNRYDGVILLQTNCGVLLSGVLQRRYHKRFILDIRDYSSEKNPVYFALEKRLVKNSFVNFISSGEYRKFLPPGEYGLVHNNISIPENIVAEIRKNRGLHRPISISFIGLIRFFEQNEKVVRSFAGNPEFLLNFFGKNAFKLKEVLQKSGYREGLDFLDQFSPEETLSLYQKTDIIDGAYGNHSPFLDYAYSNKLYYAAALGLPILVSPETAMEKIVTQYGLGFVYDPDDPGAADRLYQYYSNIDWAEFDRNCASFCKMVAEDEQKFAAAVSEFISKPLSSTV